MYWVTKVWPNNLCLKVVWVRVGQYWKWIYWVVAIQKKLTFQNSFMFNILCLFMLDIVQNDS